MIEQTLEIPLADGTSTTFIVHPERDGPHPLILFLMDAPGIREELRDMARRLATTHLVIGRAGASTCSELAVAALPSLLIPLKIAMDDHQRFNALSLVEAGGAEMVLEDEATVERLTAALLALLGDPARLAAMSAGARSAALPDATVELADMVEAVAG